MGVFVVIDVHLGTNRSSVLLHFVVVVICKLYIQTFIDK